MRSFALVAFIALIALIVVAQDSPGMYVDQAGSLVKMEHVPMSGTATKGVAKSVFVPGATPSVVWDFPGSAAPVRVSARPRFVYQLRPNQSISERDLVLVRMDQKSDHREIRVAKVGCQGRKLDGEHAHRIRSKEAHPHRRHAQERDN